MNNEFTREVVERIRALYRLEPNARRLFDWTAQRQHDATSTSIARMCQQLEVSRGEAVALARALEDASCGRFIVGRHGQRSRFMWNFSCISLGQAASGESADIEKPEDPIVDDEDDLPAEVNGDVAPAPVTSVLKLNVADAKAALANYLGIPVGSIEITIRA